MLASGLGVYRIVMIGQISREQHQLVRPSLPHRRSSGGGIKTIVFAQSSAGFVLAQSCHPAGAGFRANRPLLHYYFLFILFRFSKYLVLLTN